MRSLSGGFDIEDLGAGRWLLVGSSNPPATVALRGVGLERPRAAQCFAVSLDWSGDSVLVTLGFVDGVQTFRVRHAAIHEPLGGLYAALPLGSFDARARGFWRRVFLLARIPGGLALLRWLKARGR
jgi:hypothetical protein